MRIGITHRCHILETGNDSFRFKTSSAAATRKKKDFIHALTPALTPEHNPLVGQFSMQIPGQFCVEINSTRGQRGTLCNGRAGKAGCRGQRHRDAKETAAIESWGHRKLRLPPRGQIEGMPPRRRSLRRSWQALGNDQTEPVRNRRAMAPVQVSRPPRSRSSALRRVQVSSPQPS